MSLLRLALTQYQERRKQERRLPLAQLSFEDADALLLAQQFTGPVTVMYANGLKHEVQLPLAPVRIMLDREVK